MTAALQCLSVFGPTCAWKSETALLLAEGLSGEIVSCDSMQVYRELNAGTAKPSAEMLQRCRHHFINTLNMMEPWDANRFVQQARPLFAEIRGRGRLPVLVGGTGLYARALLYGFKMLPANRKLLRKIEDEYARENGRERLVDELRNSPGGEEIPENVIQNPRHLARAVEVLRLTGKPPWIQQQQRPQEPTMNVRQFVLLPAMDILRPRIRKRTTQMLDNGWIEETESLLQQGLLETPTAQQALGYRDIAAFLRGEIPDRDTLLELLVSRTVKYARRQRTWFRNQHPTAEILEIDVVTNAAELSDGIRKRLQNGN